jgi:Mor family transcriptional regulator
MKSSEFAKFLADKSSRNQLVLPENISDRDKELIQAYILGASPKLLTDHYKISRTRLYQILEKAKPQS